MKRKRSCPATGRAQHRPFLSLASCCLAAPSLQQQQVQPFTAQDPTANVCLFYLHYFHSCQCAESGKSTNFKKHCLPIILNDLLIYMSMWIVWKHIPPEENQRGHTQKLLCLRIIVSRKTNKQKKLPTNSQI